MTADSTDWGFGTVNILSVEVLLALRYKVAVLYLIFMEGINESETHNHCTMFYTPALHDKKLIWKNTPDKP